MTRLVVGIVIGTVVGSLVPPLLVSWIRSGSVR